MGPPYFEIGLMAFSGRSVVLGIGIFPGYACLGKHSVQFFVCKIQTLWRVMQP